MNDTIKITLISPFNGAVSYGLRVMSAYLKENGHHVDLIFVPPSTRTSLGFDLLYPESIIEDLTALCRDSDLIGFTLMSAHFPKVKDATIRMKKTLDIPIIWGGIHPTVKPEECLEYADMVCIGEGEEALLELANKLKSGDIYSIQNIWFRKDHEIIRNKVRPLEENLDKYPFQDYDLSTHYTTTNNRIVKMTRDHLKSILKEGRANKEVVISYNIITTRNCPYNCTYCCNNALRKIYHHKGRFVRKRSVENVIQELESVTSKFDFIDRIHIKDDVFFVRSREDVKTFSRLYKERIGLPIRCIFSPLETDEEKLQSMVEAGTNDIAVGIQTYNEKTLKEVYRRPALHEAITKCIKIIHTFKSKIPHPQYHLIVDNMYETTKAKQETVRFAAALPQGTDIAIFPLSLYPGTQLYEKAKQDGLTRNEVKEIYTKPWNVDVIRYHDYLSYVLSLCSKLKVNNPLRLPTETLITFLSRDELVYMFDRKVVLDLMYYSIRFSAWARHHAGKIVDVIKRPRYYTVKYYKILFHKA